MTEVRGEDLLGDGLEVRSEVRGEVRSEVHEASADLEVVQVPMAHVSVELGHLYFEDFAAGPEHLTALFRSVAPWAEAATRRAAVGEPRGSVRASTCFLVDDYFSRFSTPAEVIPMITDAAEAAGLRIDYLARESGCADSGDSRPAELALGRIVHEPVPGTTGARPPVTETGWLTNGRRSPATGPSEAFGTPAPWRPPLQSAARRHSVFVDVELWDQDEAGRRVWSCAMLAAVWQLLRLGLLRDHGRPVAVPAAPAEPPADPWPQDWQALPPVVRLRPGAAPFTAYTTMSVLSPRFLLVEAAVHTILGQFSPESAVQARITAMAGREGVLLSGELVDRIRYGFVTPGSTDPA